MLQICLAIVNFLKPEIFKKKNQQWINTFKSNAVQGCLNKALNMRNAR